MQLAPSKHPKEENNRFLILATVTTIIGVFLWYFAIAGFAFAIRCIILSKRVRDQRKLSLAVLLAIVSGIVLGYYFFS